MRHRHIARCPVCQPRQPDHSRSAAPSTSTGKTRAASTHARAKMRSPKAVGKSYAMRTTYRTRDAVCRESGSGLNKNLYSIAICVQHFSNSAFSRPRTAVVRARRSGDGAAARTRVSVRAGFGFVLAYILISYGFRV
jgi:hypothetical protein